MSDYNELEGDPQPQEVRVPPTVRGEMPKQPPVWPMVIGVILVIWASFSIISVRWLG